MGYITICADYLSSSPGHAIADKSFLISTTDKNKILNLSKKLKVDTIYLMHLIQLLLPLVMF